MPRKLKKLRESPFHFISLPSSPFPLYPQETNSLINQTPLRNKTSRSRFLEIALFYQTDQNTARRYRYFLMQLFCKLIRPRLSNWMTSSPKIPNPYKRMDRNLCNWNQSWLCGSGLKFLQKSVH